MDPSPTPQPNSTKKLFLFGFLTFYLFLISKTQKLDVRIAIFKVKKNKLQLDS